MVGVIPSVGPAIAGPLPIRKRDDPLRTLAHDRKAAVVEILLPADRYVLGTWSKHVANVTVHMLQNRIVGSPRGRRSNDNGQGNAKWK